ncbi:MAG: hypothetical protein Q9201_003369, partial [Fulgogasparrea decipioides]
MKSLLDKLVARDPTTTTLRYVVVCGNIELHRDDEPRMGLSKNVEGQKRKNDTTGFTLEGILATLDLIPYESYVENKRLGFLPFYPRPLLYSIEWVPTHLRRTAKAKNRLPWPTPTVKVKQEAKDDESEEEVEVEDTDLTDVVTPADKPKNLPNAPPPEDNKDNQDNSDGPGNSTMDNLAEPGTKNTPRHQASPKADDEVNQNDTSNHDYGEDPEAPGQHVSIFGGDTAGNVRTMTATSRRSKKTTGAGGAPKPKAAPGRSDPTTTTRRVKGQNLKARYQCSSVEPEELIHPWD